MCVCVCVCVYLCVCINDVNHFVEINVDSN